MRPRDVGDLSLEEPAVIAEFVEERGVVFGVHPKNAIGGPLIIGRRRFRTWEIRDRQHGQSSVVSHQLLSSLRRRFLEPLFLREEDEPLLDRRREWDARVVLEALHPRL